MAKRPPPGKCVHCLRDPVERTWDHVFPIAWYPDSTPIDLDKWKAPSCLDCNRELGRIESRFLSLIALTIDPKARETMGITEKVLRSLNPSFARDKADAIARANAAKRIVGSIFHGAVEDQHVYPTAGERVARSGSNPIPLLIPAGYFRKVTEKIVRGITYIESGHFIEPPMSVKFFALRDADATEMVRLIRRHGTNLERGPGIRIRRAIAPEDSVSGLYEIEFWGGQLKTYAAVSEE